MNKIIENKKKELKTNGETYFRVKVRSNASETKISDILEDDTVKIDVAAKAIGNKANEELFKFLAKEFLVLKSSIKIISGAGDRIKLIKIKK